MSSFSDLVKRVLDDDAFRTDLRRDPATALRKAGVEVTSEMIDALNAFDWESAERVARTFNPHIIT